MLQRQVPISSQGHCCTRPVAHMGWVFAGCPRCLFGVHWVRVGVAGGSSRMDEVVHGVLGAVTHEVDRGERRGHVRS